MTIEEWRERIVYMALIKEKVAQVDVEGLWPWHLPSVKATEDEIKAVEARIGERLDESYRTFLSLAGGWVAFYQMVDLFGCADLIGGPRFNRGQELMRGLGEREYRQMGFSANDLLPIAASTEEVELFVMARRHTRAPGQVIWLAESVVDVFPSFDEYFLAMMDYNRREYSALLREHPTQ